MTDKLYDLKTDVVERLTRVIDERGLERMSADELFDAMKDLAEAEYYCSVTDAIGTDHPASDDLVIFYLVNFKIFCPSKVLEDVAVVISCRDFHNYPF